MAYCIVLFDLLPFSGMLWSVPDKKCNAAQPVHYSMEQYTSNFLRQYFFVTRQAPSQIN